MVDNTNKLRHQIREIDEEVRKDLKKHEMENVEHKTQEELERLLRICEKEVPNVENMVIYFICYLLWSQHIFLRDTKFCF